MHPLHKVTVFITRQAPEGRFLALFQHPYAGIQIPAGTVDAGEEPEAAAVREAAEETGLRELTLMRSLGTQNEFLPTYQRAVLERTTVYSRPDPGSFDWAILPRGATVSLARQSSGTGSLAEGAAVGRVKDTFSHVTYMEYDNIDDPRYVTFQITGWVPSQCLTDRKVRHFFHFEYHGTQTGEWEVEADKHRFRVFWAPVEALPEIEASQRRWLKELS